MPILSIKRNLVGDRAKKFQGEASKRTARQLMMDKIMNIPDDEQERRMKRRRAET